MNLSLESERPLEPVLQGGPIERLREIRYGPSLHNLIMGVANRARGDEDNWYF